MKSANEWMTSYGYTKRTIIVTADDIKEIQEDARKELLSLLKKRLHEVDDYTPNQYVGCEGEPCYCDSCIEIRKVLDFQ